MMKGKKFVDGIKTPFSQWVKTYTIDTKEGKKSLSYLAWALTLALAGRPTQDVVRGEHGEFYVPVFGGAVVGIKQEVGAGLEQVTWLPILDGANRPIPEARITSRDVSDTINRCRAKAVAMVNGVGLAMYENGLDNVLVFLKRLGIKPDSDLSSVQAVVASSDEKNGDFIDWPPALAAVRITDPDFLWEVVFEQTADTTGELCRLPYFRLGPKGWGVAVRVCYKGATHTEILPIMGFVEVETKKGPKLLDHRPLENPTAHDWNRAVMRCLVKAIAIVSGYGLALYAKADMSAMHVEPLQRPQQQEQPADAQQAPADEAAAHQAEPAAAQPVAEAPAPAAEQPAASKPVEPAATPIRPRKSAFLGQSSDPEPPAPAQAPADDGKAELIGKVEAALVAGERQASDLLAWLGYKDTADLSVASVTDLTRGLAALTQRHRATA